MINNLYFGNDKPSTYYFGSDAADRIYYGNDLVYQKADEYVFTTDTTTLNFGAMDFDVQAPLIESLKNGLEQPYDFIIASHTWIQVEMLYSPPDEVTGLISTTAEISVAANASSNFRVGQVTFMQRRSGLTLTITITQEGYTATTTFHPTNLTFDQKGGTKYCTYTPQDAVVVEKTGTSYPWLTIAVSNGAITLKAIANLKKDPRTAQMQWQVNDDLYNLSISQDPYIMS